MGSQSTPAKSFEDLLCWQKAHAFVLAVYRISSQYPANEIYGITSQFRRAAVSIAANIAEGFKKKNNPDKIRFYNIAQGSLEECRYYLILTRDLGFPQESSMLNLLEDASKLLDSYIRTIQDSGFRIQDSL
ncbi:four helix bundle protein [Oscillatoria laete-virens NRMC-F 0139]|nr:four helix bundle protein [Oscillatoria laete-virens]MDL5054766.1 four helix bundle protein [Oscillatoria laete-virens NRMC-F 0139]